VSERPQDHEERGVQEALREAVERTLRATAGPAAVTRERAGELLDDVARLGREARDQVARRGQDAGAEIARRGQDAGAGLARRGQEAGAELGRRLEALERRLSSLEEALRRESERDPRRGSPGTGEEEAKPAQAEPHVEG
jgi:polyhydroxyalkanoate synthesis regulator phasin